MVSEFIIYDTLVTQHYMNLTEDGYYFCYVLLTLVVKYFTIFLSHGIIIEKCFHKGLSITYL